jgi:hypothetical protein
MPLIMRAAYGSRPPKLIVLLRNPVDRLHAAFWDYDHYTSKYGQTPQVVSGFPLDVSPCRDVSICCPSLQLWLWSRASWTT